MSSSTLRPFRHTATFISLTLLTALSEVAGEVTENLALTSRQLEAEKKKARRNKDRIAALETKVTEGHEKYEVLERVIRDLFDTVFVHRYRDVDPKIRVECVQALGHWIGILPDVFFDGSYLRYLGWVLSDTHSVTRLEVLKQLQGIYKKKENVAGLRAFTERFRPRMVEMATRDADPAVRASAVELVSVVRAVGLLEPDDIDAVGKLIFDAEARVRKSVARFFAENVDDLYNAKLEELGGDDVLEDALAEDAGENFDTPTLAWLKLKCLVEMLQSYDAENQGVANSLARAADSGAETVVGRESESRFSLATKACYESIPELRDWQSLTGYLLFDHTEGTVVSSSATAGNARHAFNEACKISEEQEIVLLEVLNASVRLCLVQSDREAPTSKGKKAKKPTATSSEAAQATALQLARLLPKLLNKFGPVPAAASAVLRLEHVLDLEVFQQLRQDSTTYAALLDDINKQFVTHSNQSVLTEASAALLHALSFENLHDVTEAKVQQLWEDTTGAMHTLVAGQDLADETISADRLKDILDTLRRISSLAAVSDCVVPLEQRLSPTGTVTDDAANSETPVDMLIGVLDRGLPAIEHENEDENEVEAIRVDEQLVISSTKSLMFYFMWKMRSLQKRLEDRREISQTEVSQLRDHRDAFVTRLARILQGRPGVDLVRLSATGTFLDLYTLFATLCRPADKQADRDDTVTESEKRVGSLISVISDDHEKLISSVFTAAEKAFAKKLGCKLEPAEDDAPTDDEVASDSDEDGDDTEDAAHARENSRLMLEQRLCELTGKIVLAILAGVLDASGRRAGKMRQRLTRNRGRLGRNFKEVVAYLDEPKSRKIAKNAASVKAKTTQSKLSERVVPEDSPEAEQQEDQVQVEEGDEEDLRSKELDAGNNLDDQDHDSNDNIQASPEPDGLDVLGD